MSEGIETTRQETKVTVFVVGEWPEVDMGYNHVLLRLPGGYEARLSSADAQRLGWRLNDAGGGCLANVRTEP